ncbi:MAG: TM0106 family RecB-like putative nuclease [Prolixibacteraceae bacterium]|nr:TM0106 family RecB-like putative nuclease [Prolixibacteraceae bacterium]
MLINNEILHDFIFCHDKAYRKSKHQTGIISDYQSLYNQLKQKGKENFERTITKNTNIIYNPNCDNAPKEGILLNFKFANANIDITLDGVEFTGNKNITPIFITPFEKATTADKLFISLQATYIQNEFNVQIESCKIVYGTNSRQTKIKFLSFTKPIKKLIDEMNKILSNSNAPIFYKNTHCQICEFQDSCLEKLIERDDLSLLTALKPKEIVQRNNRGIFSVKQLSYTFRPKKNPYRRRKFLPELKALAIREGKTFIQEIPILKQVETEVYLDFEGILDRGSNYLIGVILKTNEVVTEYSLWANNEEEEKDIFIELIHLLKPLNSFTIYHYGSYEIQALKRISQKLTTEQQELLKTMIDKSFNVLNIFSEYIYPPTYSNSLKEIARFLKFEWTEKDASGIQSLVWRYNWEISLDHDLKRKLIQYNLEDCKALKVVKDWLAEMPIPGSENFIKSENIKKESIFKWQRNNFLIKEFDQINKFAYFDYQREKVLIKTYPNIAAQQRKNEHTKAKIRKHKINKEVLIPRPKLCPKCNCNTIYIHNKYYRTIIDLKITKTSIKRQIVLYQINRYECNECGYVFSPKYPIVLRSKYGRALSCWVVNQSVLYRNSLNKISLQLKESFDININPSTTNIIKSNFCDYYRSTLTEIIDRVKSSSLIHIDETTFHIRKESSCYIWVFTNIDSVFYLFKSTRESEFLHDLLVDFKGVLISDFYAGYDSVNCPKQRCLIHLIRDLNDDLVKYQLDNDLKIIVVNFSKLLNEIVLTINKYGLKKRNLFKHKKSVDLFFKSISQMDFETEVCIKWQKRFTSFKNELFTFLDYDGIPWNNNNAEAAIKAVALYRREADGLSTKNRIQETLALLSIQQTCKYRGINFLEFLKSGKLSIFEFQEKRK